MPVARVEPPPAGREPVTVFAPAKLTLSLAITGIREDGFHLIDAEMVSLDFGDTLLIRPGGDSAGGSGVTLSWPDAADPDRTDGIDRTDGTDGSKIEGVAAIPLGADNLVAQALRLARRQADIHIDKRIPPGAGLGGGSSDAAAVLRWAGFDDPHAAARLGADIAFCLHGGRARVRGIGELIEPLPFVAEDLTLLTPPFGCSTPAVYRAWDDLGGPQGAHGNDLEPAALIVEPRMAQWRDQLREASREEPRLAGSGSTWFVSGHHDVPGGRTTSTIPSHFL